jgi:hypothetical protein
MESSLAPRFELALKMKLLDIYLWGTHARIYLTTGASVDLKRYQ